MQIKRTRSKTQYFGKNQMLWDLGLDANKMEQVSEVKRKITELEKEFDFGKTHYLNYNSYNNLLV